MGVQRRRPARELRTAIDCMPLISRKAMLGGIEANNIIVGAYTDRQGGVCPMLAAHRNGGRTNLASFARAWDRYTGARGRPRSATSRELNTLRAMLEASIALDELPELPSREELPRPKRDTGERHRARERRAREARRTGFGWLAQRREDADAERALTEVERRRQLLPR